MNAFDNPYNDQLVGSGAYYPYGTGNVTLVNGVMVARLLGEATEVRAATIGFLTAFRGQRLPRVWHI